MTSNFEGVSFPNLNTLDLILESLPLLNFLSKSALDYLETIKISNKGSWLEGFDGFDATQQVKLLEVIFSFLKPNAHSFKRFTFTQFNPVSDYQEELLEFLYLEHLFMENCSPLLFLNFQTCKCPQLSDVIVSAIDFSPGNFKSFPIEKLPEVINSATGAWKRRFDDAWKEFQEVEIERS